MVLAAADLTGWWVGYAIGAVVVLAVAVLVLVIIATARQIASVAQDATRALEQTRGRTETLWQFQETNRALADIAKTAADGRKAMGG